jgi:predicted RNase H-like HicB family nuclease
MAVFYVAIIERGEDGFGVFFPDVPGCVSVGATVQEAASSAQDALQAHLELALEHGEGLPQARALDAIEADPEVDEVARVLVRFEPPGKAVRVNVTLAENQLAEIDRYAAGHGFTRSGMLAQAAREMMRRGCDDVALLERAMLRAGILPRDISGKPIPARTAAARISKELIELMSAAVVSDMGMGGEG